MRVDNISYCSYSVHMELSDRTMGNERDFTAALPLLWAYDFIVAPFTRDAHGVAHSYDGWIPARPT